MIALFETGDVARRLKLTPDGVRALVRAGRLHLVASTPRGVRLFDPAAVERLRAERAARPARRTVDLMT